MNAGQNLVILFAIFVASVGCSRGPAQVETRVLSDGTKARLETYLDRAAFEQRLRTTGLRSVDFDDLPSAADETSFANDRYLSRGIVVTGEDGQYVHANFGWPDEIRPSSPPNAYAPGPPNQRGGGLPSGHFTTVTFVSERRSAVTAGFGVTFLDADAGSWWGESSLVLVSVDQMILAKIMVVRENASQEFAGLVVSGIDGVPLPAIAVAQITNGDSWPENSSGESAALDDFLFSPPVPAN